MIGPDTIHDHLAAAVLAGASRAAIVVPGRDPVPYDRLQTSLAAVIEAVSAFELAPGDRVVLALPPGYDTLVAFLALSRYAACAPLNPTYRRDELRFLLADLRPHLVVTAHADSDAAAAAAERGIRVAVVRPDVAARTAAAPPASGPDDHALALYTSGTTARPQLVLLTHRQVTRAALAIGRTLALTNDDRYLNVMPLFHVHGLQASLATLCCGGAVVCPPAFDARAFAGWLDEYGPTWYSAVPAIHQAVLTRYAGRVPPHRLRFIRSGSAPLPARVADALQRAFGVPVIEFYGMTEAANQIASNPLPPGRAKAGSVGTPTGVEVRVLDGEVLVRGDSVIRAYGGDATDDAAFVDGWLRTGDLGRLDEDGYLFLEGRRKDIINRGGEKISPMEVEACLLEHRSIADAAVFPVPSARLGEEPGCLIVPRAGESLDVVTIKEWLGVRLADYKVPRLIRIVDAIPLGSTGKVARSRLASVFEGGAPVSPAAHASQTDAAWTARLTDIWRELLQVTAIEPDDDFFDAGGDSLLATSLVGRIHDVCGAHVSLVRFLDSPTIRSLATLLAEHADQGRPTISPRLISIQNGVARPPLFCVPGHDGNCVGFANLSRALGPDVPVVGIPVSAGLDSAAAIRAAAIQHVDAIRAMWPAGPYVLAGVCQGGFVAFEIARALRARNAPVVLLAMFDCVNGAGARRFGPLAAMRTVGRKVRFHAANVRAAGTRGVGPYVVDRLRAIGRPDARTTVQMSGTYDGAVLLFQVPHMRSATSLLGWDAVLHGLVTVHDVPFHPRGLLAEPVAPIVARWLRPLLPTGATPP